MRHRGRYSGAPAEPERESEGPAVTRPDYGDIAQALDQLRELKARDLEAKRSRDHSERPTLGRAIYDLMRAIQAARGGDLG